MFGYVNANKEQLSQDDQVNYQRYYCGLCQELGNQAGGSGQLLLNYDLCFLTILLQGLYEPSITTRDFRCLMHPVSPKHGYISDATCYAASMDILLSYYSLMDNYHDDGSKLSLVAAKSLKKSYDHIRDIYPRQAAAVENYINALSASEAAGLSNIDVVSNYTGEMLGEIFNWKDDEWKSDLTSMGFYLGKFIYIIDAYDDLKRDEKKGNYNPLSYLKKESPKEFETFVRSNLTSLMAECAKSFERLPIVENTDILRNIIYSGVWTKYEYLQLKGKKKQKDIKEK